MLEYVPRGHGVPAADPGPQYDPAGQSPPDGAEGRLLEAPETHTYPAEHNPVGSERPTEAQYVPGEQLAH